MLSATQDDKRKAWFPSQLKDFMHEVIPRHLRGFSGKNIYNHRVTDSQEDWWCEVRFFPLSFLPLLPCF
eukprot:m.343732 g.343732  ORF g.343732 m.343732 type:complete len:69 (+) comp55782_c1_seq23:2383-2589(+)